MQQINHVVVQLSQADCLAVTARLNQQVHLLEMDGDSCRLKPSNRKRPRRTLELPRQSHCPNNLPLACLLRRLRQARFQISDGGGDNLCAQGGPRQRIQKVIVRSRLADNS